MSTCVIVLEEKQPAEELLTKLKASQTPIICSDLVEPLIPKSNLKKENGVSQASGIVNQVNFNAVKLFNPKLARKDRQRTLSTWLIPFGFITGLSFSQMTGLETFTELGLPNQFEKVCGGLIGMIAGWLGSFFSAGSINQEIDDDLRALRKKSEQGLWLLILETPIETELPWNIIKDIAARDIISIGKE